MKRFQFLSFRNKTRHGILIIALLILFVQITVIGCTDTTNQDETIVDNETTISLDPSKESTLDQTTDNTINDNSSNTTDSQTTINLFEGVQYSFSGLDSHGSIKFIKDQCNDFIKNNVNFVLESRSEDGKLSNGTLISVKAIYDPKLFQEKNIIAESDTNDICVSGLYTIKTANDFSENRAWIQLFDNTGINSTCWVCIDNTGKPLHKIIDNNNTIQSISPYGNGYSHIVHSTNRVDVVNLNGSITSSYDQNNSNVVMAYGDGYTFIRTNISDFNNNYDEFYILNGDGILLRVFTVLVDGQAVAGRIRGVDYCGDGVFGIAMSNGEAWYYFARNDKLLINVDSDNNIDALTNVRFNTNNHYACIELTANDYYAIVLLSSTGNIYRLRLPSYMGNIYNWWQDVTTDDGICLLWSTDYGHTCQLFLAYDISNIRKADYVMMDDSWLRKIDGENIKADTVFANGYVALPLIGSDNKKYVALFDKSFNIALDPIKAELIDFSGTRLTLKQREYITETSYQEKINIYDVSGNIVFCLSDIGYNDISPYVNGFAKVSRGYSTKTIRYINEDGIILFDNIIIDEVNTIDLNN